MNQRAIHSAAKKIVIIGGGIAGIKLALKLVSGKHDRVILVDKNNYIFFPPLIYQLATGFLETSNISYPFRKLFRKKDNIQFRMAEFIRVDPASHTCYLSNGEIIYDYLVFATGTRTNYYGNENIIRNAIPMKTVNDALNMRNILLQAFEQASISPDPAERKKLQTIVIAGGGPTGVEVSGMLAELRKYIRTKDYPELLAESGEIYLVNSSPELLKQMSERSQRGAYKTLVRLGVKIILNTQVTDYIDDEVVLSNGERIRTKNLIWAAGVIGIHFEGIPSTCIGQGKRMITDEFNRVRGLEDIYAIGDTCIQKADARFPDGHPQLAQVALQQGQNLARNFAAISRGEPMKPFRYTDKGIMAIIGRKRAVVDLFKSRLHLCGSIALLIWLLTHLMSLISHLNKFKTLFNWLISYVTMDQSLRMIIRPKTDAQ